MNPTHVHLFLNHAPFFAVLFGLYFLTMGIWKKSVGMKLSAVTLFTIGAVIVIPVFLTGESAEHAVEGLPGVTEAVVETHEESATLAMYSMMTLGLLSVTTMVVFSRRHKIPAPLFAAICVLALTSAGLIGRTAYLGGQIRHTEIRSDAQPGGLENQEDEAKR